MEAVRKSRKLKVLIIISILFACWVVIAPLLANYLVFQKPVQKADAVVVFSGSSEFSDRTREAAAIFQAGTANRVILTDDRLQGGWDNVLKRNPTFAEQARWRLIDLGVNEEAIEVLPGNVEGTHDEANLIVKTAAERNFNSVIIVTSAYHSRRAFSSIEGAMQSQGVTLIVGVQSPAERPGPFWWLTIDGWGTVGLEWLKTGYYLIRY